MAATKKWDLEPNNTLVILDGGKSSFDLELLMDRLTSTIPIGIPPLSDWDYVPFAEPDLDGEHTGFAVRPSQAPKWIRTLPLLFPTSRRGVNNND